MYQYMLLPLVFMLFLFICYPLYVLFSLPKTRQILKKFNWTEYQGVLR